MIKTFYLNNLTTTQGINDVMSALHSRLQLSFIARATNSYAIIVRDTSEKISLAEALIADLDKAR